MENAKNVDSPQSMVSLQTYAATLPELATRVKTHPAMEAVNYEFEYYRLKRRIHDLHNAKGRWHTQHAVADLFEAVGLKGERPVNQNKKEIKNGS